MLNFIVQIIHIIQINLFEETEFGLIHSKNVRVFTVYYLLPYFGFIGWVYSNGLLSTLLNNIKMSIRHHCFLFGLVCFALCGHLFLTVHLPFSYRRDV